MHFLFCKKSVFSVLFLIFFLLGTICGIFLLRCILLSDNSWLSAYCSLLQRSPSGHPLMVLWFYVLPFLGVLVTAILPGGARLVYLLAFFRGCFLAYTFGAFYFLGISFRPVLLRSMLTLPMFFALCRRVAVIS